MKKRASRAVLLPAEACQFAFAAPRAIDGNAPTKLSRKAGETNADEVIGHADVDEAERLLETLRQELVEDRGATFAMGEILALMKSATSFYALPWISRHFRSRKPHHHNTGANDCSLSYRPDWARADWDLGGRTQRLGLTVINITATVLFMATKCRLASAIHIMSFVAYAGGVGVQHPAPRITRGQIYKSVESEIGVFALRSQVPEGCVMACAMKRRLRPIFNAANDAVERVLSKNESRGADAPRPLNLS